ncbi:Abortive infection protein [Desulfurobacterium thermolithotrophum DSM 11699]|uniref:Abortive infection protein n=1 Tax=Desulfurobacterium thermolithotrophum (strain DSM 11699 / BSA) TaxID=868864 RepID=F0S3F0_DESTD|nr:CPBP family intramembrane glutamic endopeptidase [Desulfurobacterium thermolithotrophum]ADY73372.1 Abortive infection protein [Desulfurobacterium thermolithotrophum DSM 11699]
MARKKCKSCRFVKLYFVVIFVSSIVVRFFKDYSAVVSFFLMVGIPILLLRKTPEELGYKNFLKGLKWGIGTSLLILPVYALLCSNFGEINTHFKSFLSIILFYFTVAVAEETFFRGYLYSEIENEPLFGPISKANFVSSFLFAIAHVLIYYNPIMFKVFFPSLVMGYIYERSKSIGAPIIFHWLSDIIYQFVRC